MFHVYFDCMRKLYKGQRCKETIKDWPTMNDHSNNSFVHLALGIDLVFLRSPLKVPYRVTKKMYLESVAGFVIQALSQ